MTPREPRPDLSTDKYPQLAVAWARRYIDRGWAVLPLWGLKPQDGRWVCLCGRPSCPTPGKHPLGVLAPEGAYSASRDPSAVERWWGAHPQSNVGVATGTISGIVVAPDFDPRHEGAAEALESLQREVGQLPDTLRCITGGGGWHAYFATDEELSGRSLGTGLDSRAEGHLVAAPPSRHASGRRYEWDDWEHHVEPLPEGLRERLTGGLRRPFTVAAVPETLPAVSRDDLPKGAARSLYGGGAKPSHQRIFEAALALSREDAVSRVLGDGSRYDDATILGAVAASPAGEALMERGGIKAMQQVSSARLRVSESVHAALGWTDAVLTLPWPSRRSRSLLRVLLAFGLGAVRWGRVLEDGTLELRASYAQLEDIGPTSTSVIDRSLPHLGGWLTVIRPGDRPLELLKEGETRIDEPVHATVWGLSLPLQRGERHKWGHTDAQGISLLFNITDASIRNPSIPTRADLILASHDAMRRDALGASADTLLQVLHLGEVTTPQLASLLGLKPRGLRQHLLKLKGYGLVEIDDGSVTTPEGIRSDPDALIDILDDIAVKAGTRDAGGRRRERNARNRQGIKRILERSPEDSL